MKKKILALGGNVFEVTATTTGFQQKGSKNCRSDEEMSCFKEIERNPGRTYS